MNQQLKDLIARNGMPIDRVQALVDLAGGDEAWIESILTNATKTEKAAMFSGVAFKADSSTPPADVLLALTAAYEAAGDWSVVLATLAQITPPAAKSTRMSPLEAAVKGYVWDGR